MFDLEANQERIAKLPKWAQDAIEHLSSERQAAINRLNEFQNHQTKTSVWTEALTCLGERPGPSYNRCYIQSDHVVVEGGGVQLEVYAGDKAIRLRWGEASRLASLERVALHITGCNAMSLSLKE
jgi:hypothetical protein